MYVDWMMVCVYVSRYVYPHAIYVYIQLFAMRTWACDTVIKNQYSNRIELIILPMAVQVGTNFDHIAGRENHVTGWIGFHDLHRFAPICTDLFSTSAGSELAFHHTFGFVCIFTHSVIYTINYKWPRLFFFVDWPHCLCGAKRERATA